MNQDELEQAARALFEEDMAGSAWPETWDTSSERTKSVYYNWIKEH